MVTIRKTGGKSGPTILGTDSHGEGYAPQNVEGVIGPKPSEVTSVPRRAPKVDPTAGLSLASDFTEPVEDLGGFNWFLYGDYKIGKTSLTSRFPDPHHFMFEPGGKGLRIRGRNVETWRDFQGYVKLLKKTSEFQTIMIDTSDMAYQRCFKHVCQVNGFEHPTDENDFGKSWDKIRDEFMEQMLSIAHTGRGIVFVSHAETIGDLQKYDGTKFSQIVPSVAKQARKFIGAWVDIIAYYGYFKTERYLVINGTTDEIMSGHRIERHFLTPEGDRVQAIPMGYSADEAWANITLAFNNQQEEVHVLKRADPLAGTQVKREKPRR